MTTRIPDALTMAVAAVEYAVNTRVLSKFEREAVVEWRAHGPYDKSDQPMVFANVVVRKPLVQWASDPGYGDYDLVVQA